LEGVLGFQGGRKVPPAGKGPEHRAKKWEPVFGISDAITKTRPLQSL
jgi:hypothetical protein